MQVRTAGVGLGRHSCCSGSLLDREDSSFAASEVLAQDCHRFCTNFMPRGVSWAVRGSEGPAGQ